MQHRDFLMVCVTFVNMIAPHLTTNLKTFASVELLSLGGAISIFQCSELHAQSSVKLANIYPNSATSHDTHMVSWDLCFCYFTESFLKSYFCPCDNKMLHTGGVIGYCLLCSYCLSNGSFSSPLLSSSHL